MTGGAQIARSNGNQPAFGRAAVRGQPLEPLAPAPRVGQGQCKCGLQEKQNVFLQDLAGCRKLACMHMHVQRHASRCQAGRCMRASRVRRAHAMRDAPPLPPVSLGSVLLHSGVVLTRAVV